MKSNGIRTFIRQSLRCGTEELPQRSDIVHAQANPRVGKENLRQLLRPAPSTLYRFDSRHPDRIFREGFHAHDACALEDLRVADIDNHVSAPDLSRRRGKAAFIATSPLKSVCRRYGLGFMINQSLRQDSPPDGCSAAGFIYKLDGRGLPGLEINAILPRNHQFADDKEIAIPGNIGPKRIIKAKDIVNRVLIRNRQCQVEDEPSSSDEEYIDVTELHQRGNRRPVHLESENDAQDRGRRLRPLNKRPAGGS